MELVGVGNALMDVIAYVDEAFAPKCGFHNNAVVHLQADRLDSILSQLPDASHSAGGGAANVARIAAYLGSKSIMVGMVGEDERGRSYSADLASAGVECLLSRSAARTGVFCALIRSDGGRTLLVAPSAALDLGFGAAPTSAFKPDRTLFLECFLLRDKSFFMDCLKGARDAGMRIALDLSSRDLAAAERDFILEILPCYCDTLFANEDEFAALTSLPLREGLDLFASDSLEIVVKRAERGAVWSLGGETVDSPVRAVQPVDETGAGDAFAAAFLHGRSLGQAPERCLRLGNRIAEEVLAVPGLGVDPDRIRRAADSLIP